MNGIDKLKDRLVREYAKKTKMSGRVFRRAEKVMISGGSHGVRLWKPYPIFAVRAEGSTVRDVDGRDYIDYWQGHYANILGHNPALIRRETAAGARKGSLHTGFEALEQIELAELLVRLSGLKGATVRFTTSGTLATMYSVMMSEAFTGRDIVLKIGGGWHGASPFLLKGVKYDPEIGFEMRESGGVLDDILRRTLVARYNDPEDLERIMKDKGDRIACFILEPFLGVSGFLPATKEYLETARRLTARHGVVLIFDEIISGFRFAPSGVQKLYGVQPDLSVFGKIIGGGHAVAAVVGRRDVMEVCEGAPGVRVRFEGGTFSAHTEYMRAGLAMLRHLVRNAGTIYPRLAGMGERLRTGMARAFDEAGVPAVVSGGGNDVVAGSSMAMASFPLAGAVLKTPEDFNDSRRSSVQMREEILKLALLNEGINVVHGGGSVSVAHKTSEIDRTIEAFGQAARLFKKYLY